LLFLVDDCGGLTSTAARTKANALQYSLRYESIDGRPFGCSYARRHCRPASAVTVAVERPATRFSSSRPYRRQRYPHPHHRLEQHGRIRVTHFARNTGSWLLPLLHCVHVVEPSEEKVDDRADGRPLLGQLS
jgi:hypothetical protein